MRKMAKVYSMSKNLFFKKLFSGLLVISIINSQAPKAVAADKTSKPLSGLSSSDDLKLTGLADEYAVGKTPGIVMMKINLWGGVRKPGIYHVPIGTDLVSLISYAGGPTANAELQNTRIRRTIENKNNSIPVDVEDLVKGKDSATNPDLKVNDIVVIPETQPAVGSNTMVVLTLVATLVSIAATSAVLLKK